MQYFKHVNGKVTETQNIPDWAEVPEGFQEGTANVGDTYVSGEIIAAVPPIAPSVTIRDSIQNRKTMYPRVEIQLELLWVGMDAEPEKRIEPFYSTILNIKQTIQRESVLKSTEVAL